jgi:hypothetical protein
MGTEGVPNPADGGHSYESQCGKKYGWYDYDKKLWEERFSLLLLLHHHVAKYLTLWYRTEQFFIGHTNASTPECIKIYHIINFQICKLAWLF